MTKNLIAGAPGALASLASAAMLVACGGDGGSDPSPGGGNAPTVASAVAGTPMYGRSLVLTVTGTNLGTGLAVTATGCDNVAIDASSSGPSTAQYACTVSAMGSGQFTVKRADTGATLATVPFTVPAPQVTIAFGNGAAVNGNIVITLAPDKTPVTVKNFLAYVNSGFYAGTVFHRVSPGFVVQGGGYTAPLDANTQVLKATDAPIALEVGKGLSNTQWTIAMARTDDPASATSQFFINLVDNSGFLDPGISAGYAVFGTVTSGTADVSAIVGAPCTAIPLFLPNGECTPTPNMVISAATQTR
jgi:peptidyl-prolyl cis-trans isomerase A (cyclophilin A)